MANVMVVHPKTGSALGSRGEGAMSKPREKVGEKVSPAPLDRYGPDGLFHEDHDVEER